MGHDADGRGGFGVGRWPRQQDPYADPKSSLLSSLRAARAAVLSKVEDLSEYDVRRPLTPTGTNLLGLVKHLTATEARYLGQAFGRPLPELAHQVAAGDDMWATADETRAEIVAGYQRACDHADDVVGDLDLDAPGLVPWWTWSPDVVLFNVLVHVLAETSRHAGHADILREQIDGAVEGRVPSRQDQERQRLHHNRVERAARTASDADGAHPLRHKD